MWPDMLGLGWLWGVLTSLGVIVVMIGLSRAQLSLDRTASPDDLQVLRYRCEAGDRIPPEVERLTRTVTGSHAETDASGLFGAHDSHERRERQ